MNPHTNTYIQRKAIAPTAARLGWRCEGDLLIMPHSAPDGTPVGERVRKADGSRWYRHGATRRKHADARLYHLPDIADKIADTLYLVEGESDVATMIEAGHGNTAGIFGATNVPADLADIVRSWQARRVITLFDADDAGETARRLVDERLADSDIDCRHANTGWKQCNDVNDLWVQCQADSLRFDMALAGCIELSAMAAHKPLPAQLAPAPVYEDGGRDDAGANAYFDALERRAIITRPRFVSMIRALNASELHVTASAPHFEGVFAPSDMHSHLERRGYKCSIRQVKNALQTSPIIDHVGHGKYQMTDNPTFGMRLRARLEGAIAKTLYRRKLPAWVYGDSVDVSDSLYGGIERRELHMSKEDADKALRTIDSESDMLWDSIDLQPFTIPDDAGDLRAWWWKLNISEGDKLARGDIYERTGFAPRQQPAIRNLAGGISRARFRYVEADTAQQARAMSKERCYAMPAKFQNQWKLQLPSEYGYSGGQVEMLKALDDDRKVQKTSTIRDKDIADKNCTMPAPILPEVAETDTIHSESFVTRALWYTMLDKGITTKEAWAGKEVTLEAIEAHLMALPDMIQLDDGTEIPF